MINIYNQFATLIFEKAVTFDILFQQILLSALNWHFISTNTPFRARLAWKEKRDTL